MTIKGQQNVIQLQITVDDAVLMEVLESQADFRGIEPSRMKSVSLGKETVELAGGLKTYCALFSPN